MVFLKKWNIYRNVLKLRIKSVIIIISMTLASTFSEALGIGIFYPIFQYVNSKGDMSILLEKSSIWEYVVRIFGTVNIEISLIVLLVASFLFFLGRQVLMYVRSVYMAKLNKYLEMQLCKKLFNKYLETDTEYQDNMPIGKFTNILTKEVVNASAGIMSPIELVTYLIMLVIFFTMLMLISLEMTLISVIVLLVASRVPKIWINQSEVVGRNLVATNNSLVSFLVERIRSTRLVRLSGTERAEKFLFDSLINKQRKYYILSSVLTSRTELVLEPVVVSLSLIFLYFSVSVYDMQIELIGLYMVVALRLLPIVKASILQWQGVKNSLGSIEIVYKRNNEMDKFKENDAGIKKIASNNISLSFEKVSYSYASSNTFALKNISLAIPANKITAIVGPSGSGKSTFVDLIPRLRKPDNGRILINNLSILDYDLKSLRQSISYVSQSPQIFNGTVSDHIRYGKSNATNREVQLAASLAGADNFIKDLPEKYDTILGEEAIRLSGGQRQRLDLARAVVRQSPILILDEPTSSLDAESENKFGQALLRIHNEVNPTIIIIAHRLASICDADQIIVLNNGVVEDARTHKSLLHNNGWYSKAWNMQKVKS